MTGAWDNARQSILSNGNLSRIGRSNGLEICANRNRANTGALSVVQVATLVEAIIGAVYKDSDYASSTVEAVMEELGLTYAVTLKHPLPFHIRDYMSTVYN